MKQSLPLLTLLALFASNAGATLIDFESYNVGALASVTSGTDDKEFTGQDGWSVSTSSSAGEVITTADSGEYVGGKAIGGRTYIGANAGYTLSNAYSFDLRLDGGSETGLGHWNDGDADGRYDQSEVELQVGIVSDGLTPYAFGVRTAGFGTRIWADGAGGAITTGDGLTGSLGHWHRFTVTYVANGGDYDITIAVRDLTASTDVDFDSTTPGVQPWSLTVTAAQFGVPIANAEGLVVRTSGQFGNGLIDNINTAASASGFAGWATGLGLSGDSDEDFDLDGLPDGVEYVVGTNPKVANASPVTLDASGSDLVFTFPRDDASETPDATVTVEIGTTLDSWPLVYQVGADTISSDPGVTVSENAAAPDTITVTVPKNTDPAKFGRLKVTIAP
jgi:hypothetical protein